MENNKYVNDEYENYIRVNSKEGKRNRLAEWIFLMRVNLAYFILNRRSSKQKLNGEEQKSIKSTGRLPYLEGSESEAFKRRDAIWLAKDLMPYDLISFDIFDTLILRPFAQPIDLFIVVGKKLGIMNFQTIRQQAERDARAEKRALLGTNEVTIYDIYQKVNQKTGIEVETGVNAEFETELDFCFANPYMLRVFKLLREQGKRIIIASDMYYPQEMMVRLLNSCGYEGYEKLYVSCDYICSKRSGGLYKNILHDYQEMRIAHVGDNYESDIECAKKIGITSFYYQNCHEIGNRYRSDGMSSLIGSFYAGIVNTHLHNGVRIYNPYYEYGFIYGGLYILGYCNWIYQKAKKEGIEKILFLSRDGDIYQKVFNRLFKDIPNEYVYWSRIANLKATIKTNRYEFLRRMVLNKAYLPIPISISDMFEAISLDFLIEKIVQYGLKKEDLLVPELVPVVEKICIDHWDSIVQQYEKDSEATQKYLQGVIAGKKKVAIVDVGWIGSGPLGIKELVEKKWKMDCEVKCYVAASFHSTPAFNVNEIMSSETEAYIFSHMYNRNLFDIHRSSNKGMNNSLFELFTQANQPSFAGLTIDGEFQFDVSELSNYEINSQIQKGIMDFCVLYRRYTSKYEYMMNVAGYDVYLPFRMLTRDLKFFRNIFGNYKYSFEVANNAKRQVQETLGDAMRQRNLN